MIEHIKDLSLTVFMACSLNGDYAGLGYEDPQQAQVAWMRLVQQYYDISGDSEQAEKTALLASILALEARAVYIDYAIEVMRSVYVEGVAALLREDLPACKFSEETYLGDIELLIKKERPNKLRYTQLKAQYDAIDKGGKVTTKQTRTDYMELLMEINQHTGAQYGEDVSMEVYGLGVKRLKAHYKHQKDQQSKWQTS
jgi:hypothetical protein